MKRVIASLLPVLWVGLAAGQSAPPLTVVMVIDQFPLDLVERYGDLFGEDGFKRLERDGALFTECRYSHAVLETGPGHVTIGTGCNPRTHGIVANGWQKPSGSEVYCVECTSARPVNDNGRQDSLKSSCPENVRCDGLSDAWRGAFGDQARIWSLSLKDRAAIGMGMHEADGALWMDRSSGKFETSSYYLDHLPQWCINYNRNAGRFFDGTWERAVRPDGYYRCDTDAAWFEDGTKAGLLNTLPKQITGGDSLAGKGYVRALYATPFGNDLLYGLAKECVRAEQLGKDKTPDLLWVSFSSNDVCGHFFGPNSHEICDMTVRTDRVLADFLKHLDAQVGKGNYWFVLTADHGVCPPHESALMPSGMGGRFDTERMKSELEDHLAQTFMNGLLPKGGVISAFEIPTISFKLTAVETESLDLRSLATAAANWLAAQPGVSQTAITLSMEDVAAISDSRLRSHIEQSYDSERFSHVYLHPQPYWQSNGVCSNHGTIHGYDTHVPLYFMGKAFTRGRMSTAADPVDLAPTLAAAAGVTWTAPRDGRVLGDALIK
ncbi:MAG: alkaline phosphatase family protein [bacterium]|nr:alkaline phosphatase family protein [bacterium]